MTTPLRAARRPRRDARANRRAGSTPASCASTAATDPATLDADLGRGRGRPARRPACAAAGRLRVGRQAAEGRPRAARAGDAGAALRVLMFRELRAAVAREAGRWLALQAGEAAAPRPAGVMRPAAPASTAPRSRGDRAHPRGHRRRRDLPGQLHLPPARPGLRLAAGAVPAAARAPAGGLRRLHRLLPRRGGRRTDARAVVLARAVRAQRGRRAHRPADEGHGVALHGAPEGDSETARHPLARHQEPRREPDDRRPAAQRPRPHRADRLGEGAGAVRRRAVRHGVPDDLDGAGAAARPRSASPSCCARSSPAARSPARPSTTRWS